MPSHEPVPLWRKFLDPRECGWLNLLLPAIIVAAVLYGLEINPGAQFAFSCLALIPLSAMLGDATEVIADYLGPTPGALINATMGNACELILSIFGVFKNIDNIVKASLTGSIIGNLLLVLGSSLIVGGSKFKEQKMDAMAVSVYGNMAILSSTLLFLPALFANSLPAAYANRKYAVDVVSVGTAIVLMIAYLLQLGFQLWTHKEWFMNKEEDGEKAKEEGKAETTELAPVKNPALDKQPSSSDKPLTKSESRNGAPEGLPRAVSLFDRPVLHEEDEEEEPMSLRAALIQITIATALVSFMSEVLVSSVEYTAEKAGLGDVFTGVVIIAIVGNAAEHTTAILAAYKDKLDISVAITFGSSLQIAQFVFPLLVLISCGRSGGPMTMVFTNMEAVAIFFSVLTAWVICSDAKTTWLEGAMLFCLYVVFSLLFFFVPADNSSGYGTIETVVIINGTAMLE